MKGGCLRQLVIGLLAVGLLIGVYRGYSAYRHAQREPLYLTTFVGDTMAAFSERNGLPREDFTEKQDTSAHYRQAAVSRWEDPTKIVLTYLAGDCSVTLPAGRKFSARYMAGYINNVFMMLPLEPMRLREARRVTHGLVRQLEAAGWTRKLYNSPIKRTDFTNGRKRVGRWHLCGDPEIVAHLMLRDYHDMPPGSLIPPAILGGSPPEDAPLELLLKVGIGFTVSYTTERYKMWKALLDARRRAVHGDADKALPLKVWLDDPDWRPDGGLDN